MAEKPDNYTIDLIKRTASVSAAERNAAQDEFATMMAQALEMPLRQGNLFGDVIGGIYQPEEFAPGTNPEYPLDLLAPGEEDEFIAFTIPSLGRIPERVVASDYVVIPTYKIGNSIQWALRFAQHASWNVVSRAMEVMQAGFTKKINDDGWHTLLAAAYDRNLLVYDADAAIGNFTKRLVSLAKTTMARNAGGNGGSGGKRGQLTDIFLSLEGIEDIRNWGLDQIDEVSRREIYLASDDSSAVTRIFGVNLHPMYEFGEGQEYQNFFTSTLAGGLQSTDVELAIGLDLKNKDSFIMPHRGSVEVFADPTLHRRQEEGYYGWYELGFAVLDSRRVLALSY